MLLPRQMGSTPADLLVGCGKQGVVYVLDRSQPGPGLGSYNGPNGPDRAVQTFDLYPGRVPSGPGRPTGDDHDMPGVFGGPAYFAGPAGQLVYYGGSSGPVKAFALHNSRLAPATIAGGAPNQTQDTFPGSTTTPTISSNGGVTGTAIMWAVLRVNPHRLYAFDATDLTQRLFVGDAGPWNNPDGNDFPTPTAIGGKVYVSASNFVAVFGPGKVGKEHKDGKDGKEKEIRKDRKDTRDNNGGKLRLHEAVAGRQPADHGAVTGLVAEHIHEAPGGAVGQAFITPAERPEVGVATRTERDPECEHA
jgi:hypothetical protein